MEIYPINETTEVVIADSADAAAVFGAIRFISTAQQAIAQHGSFSVALSGGSTPKRMYEAITSQTNISRIDWSKVNIFWSDERAVPQDHVDSNFHMAMQYFSKAPCNLAKIYRMRADEKDLAKAALEYEQLIKSRCYEERFDLVLLGLGQDAHTASLFPHTKALDITNQLVCENFIPSLNTWRMTLTFSCINQANKILVLAYGKDKGLPLKNIIVGKRDPYLYPAQKLGNGVGSVLYIIDQAAADEAALLAKSLRLLKNNARLPLFLAPSPL